MKIAVVTGAAQGIGRRTAEVFAAAGDGLLLMDMQPFTGTVAGGGAGGGGGGGGLGDGSDEGWGGRGVRCNAVCPGWVKTEMDIADQAAGGGYNDADIEGVNPMGRFASPEDIAQAILFLAEPERSGFVNGHTLVVDGGWTSDGSWQSLRMKKR